MMRKDLTSRTARTGGDDRHPPPGERTYEGGQTYAIPFSTVWEAAAKLASGGLRGWTRVSADYNAGVIEADIRGVLLTASAMISIVLDADAQTRVDVRIRETHHWHTRLRGGATRIQGLFRALDRSIAARPEHIVDTRHVDPDGEA